MVSGLGLAWGLGSGFGSSEQGFVFSFSTWTPEVCKIIASWAVFIGCEPLFYLVWGFRYLLVVRVRA